MPGLVPGIHVLTASPKKDVDGRDKPGHDGDMCHAGTISLHHDYFPIHGRIIMARKARKYSKKASADVERVMKKRKAGTLKSGRSGRKVTSRKQAIAIGLSEARAEGKKVPKKASKKKALKKKASKKKTAKKRKAKK
jgi:hypothetical protein